MDTIILDNGGKTFDRYTIINKDGDMFGASVNPFHPQGFGMFCGNVVEYQEKQWRMMNLLKRDNSGFKRRAINKCRNAYVKEAKENPQWIGTIVDVASLPEMVQRFVKRIEN